jgi:hypothetical protein
MMSWVMSYTVDIVSAPPPRSYEAALDLRDQLTDERDARVSGETGSRFEEPSEEMRELHRRLTARFPCICDAPEGPWSDGPLLNNFGQRVTTLGISFSRVEEVLPFLIATALDMGFWVVDAQDEALHLPDGRVLRAPADAPAGPVDGPVATVRRRPWWRFWR